MWLSVATVSIANLLSSLTVFPACHIVVLLERAKLLAEPSAYRMLTPAENQLFVNTSAVVADCHKRFDVEGACEFELYGPNGRVAEADMASEDVIEQEIRDAKEGRILGAHFGITCSSWSVIQRLFNGGTRCAENPYGSNLWEREIQGNRELSLAWKLIRVFLELNIPVTLENPESSAIWWTDEMLAWLELDSCEIAKIDMCMMMLRPPDWTPELLDDLRIKKSTRVVGTVKGLASISVRCNRNHEHVEAIGHVKVDGKRVSRAAAAGAYPIVFARKLARLFAAHWSSPLIDA